MVKQYHICKSEYITDNILDWDSEFWAQADTAFIDQFHEKSSDHRPQSSAKLSYCKEGIFLIFKVKDRYVLSVNTEYNSKVNEDSCVEWFIRPQASEGYFNFEINAGGTLHVNYIIDPDRDEEGKRKNIRAVSEFHAKQIKIYTSMPKVVYPEIQEARTWLLSLFIPFSFFDHYTKIQKIDGSIWQGNLYKCGDKTSKPHWVAWSPVKELNFHQPIHFGEFLFEK
jgi:hypothetical protein